MASKKKKNRWALVWTDTPYKVVNSIGLPQLAPTYLYHHAVVLEYDPLCYYYTRSHRCWQPTAQFNLFNHGRPRCTLGEC